MSRKIRRTADFEIILDVKNDTFIVPPRDSQRNAILNKAIAEFADDLASLHSLASHFVPGQDTLHVQERTHAELSDEEIMEDWQIPLMRAMATVATENHGDLLEIGFGRGISSGIIQEMGVRSHTIVECNESVIERFHQWRQGFPDRDIRLIEGRWQDVINRFSIYDAVFFHTYPLNEQEYLELVANRSTFAEHFFPTASTVLRSGGIFTYMTNEIDSLSRGHQRALLQYFGSFSVHLQPLKIPVDVRDTWWSDSMVIVKAVK
jgi:guanidinoacetate N-methyltransferase